jgi:hypothetical protein
MDQGPGEMMERYVVGWACIRNIGFSNLLSFMFVWVSQVNKTFKNTKGNLNAMCLAGNAAYTNFMVLGLICLGLKPTIYWIWGPHTNHYIPNVVQPTLWSHYSDINIIVYGSIILVIKTTIFITWGKHTDYYWVRILC